MKDKLLAGFLFAVVCLTLASTAMGTTWYVDGVTGNDHHSCTSPSTACKTISHAIKLAASGGTINVAPATYRENLTIGSSMRILGSGASTTIVDAGRAGSVVSISHGNVTLSGMTFRNGRSKNGCCGAGIANGGTLTLSNSIVSGNIADSGGGGIGNGGTLTLSNSIISANAVNISCSEFCVGEGGGIHNSGRLVIDNSTISGNAVNTSCPQGSPCLTAFSGGGGISNTGGGAVTIRNSTISGNRALVAGAIKNLGIASKVAIINSTVSGNSSPTSAAIFTWEGTVTISNSTIGRNYAAGVIVQESFGSGAATLQNSIVANNSGANCLGVTSKGYNLSRDGSCDFSGPGDLNNTNPILGPLQDNGGPTKTMALLSGSPAVDAGDPSGCKVRTDQRGEPRPDPEDTGGCDIGAYELQTD
jgi:hypothetical protein